MMRKLVGVGVGVAVVAVAAGCGGESSGVARPQSSSAPPEASASSAPRTAATISPCDELPAGIVTALGVDPATKEDTSIRGQQVAERGCGWVGRDVLVDVHVTNATVALYQTRDDFVNVRILSVAGLPSLSSQLRDDPRGCRVISDIPAGGLIAQVGIKAEHQASVGVDSCTAAIRVMEQVAPVLLKPQ